MRVKVAEIIGKYCTMNVNLLWAELLVMPKNDENKKSVNKNKK